LTGDGHRSEKALILAQSTPLTLPMRAKTRAQDNGADSEDKRGHDKQRKNKQPFVRW
jgi:hypothetical protein